MDGNGIGWLGKNKVFIVRFLGCFLVMFDNLSIYFEMYCLVYRLFFYFGKFVNLFYCECGIW